MSSSTDVLSDGSVYSFRENGSSDFKKGSKGKTFDDETKSEINDLLFHVPEIKKHFTIHNKIGSGTFSCVFIASLRNHRQLKERFALKHILPTSLPSRIENELRCLMDIGGCDNVIGVKACMRHQDHVVIVMPHFAHDVFQDYFQELTLAEVRDYMKNLLIALRRVHKFNIIHRDVKPTNFLFNRKTKSYALVDFGLAHKVNSSSIDADKTPIASGQGEKAEDSDVLTPTRTDNKNAKRKADVLSPHEENAAKCARYTRKSVEPVAKEEENTLKASTEDKDLAAKHKDLIKDFSIVLDPKVSPVLESGKPQHDLLLGKSRSPRRVLLTKQLQFANKPDALQRRPLQPTKLQPSKLQGAKHGQRTALVIHRGGKPHYTTVAQKSCKCFGQPSVCSVCMSRKHQVAPRAGTPGYRPPEVLMKCPDQTTAVDIWAAGVIFLSLLCRRHPFFKANDDMTALAQILTIFGSEAMKVASRAFGKELTVSPTIPGVDLGTLVKKFRQLNHSDKSSKNCETADEETIELLKRLLDLNPHTRITAEEALKHTYFADSES